MNIVVKRAPGVCHRFGLPVPQIIPSSTRMPTRAPQTNQRIATLRVDRQVIATPPNPRNGVPPSKIRDVDSQEKAARTGTTKVRSRPPAQVAIKWRKNLLLLSSRA